MSDIEVPKCTNSLPPGVACLGDKCGVNLRRSQASKGEPGVRDAISLAQENCMRERGMPLPRRSREAEAEPVAEPAAEPEPEEEEEEEVPTQQEDEEEEEIAEEPSSLRK